MNQSTIAKNTLFLYFRMLLILFVSLYTSRVVLQTLGVNDFGLYQAVGGVIALLSFVNNALASGSSRYLTFSLGKGNFNDLKKTFSSVLLIHIFLALGIMLIAETIGLWFVHNKLNIPVDRFDAAVFAYHFTIISAFFSITQVPYNASIISHEKMSAFAYISILEVFLRLAIAYGIQLGSFDRLKTYAILLCLVQICIAYIYRIFCFKNFPECRSLFAFDKNIVKKILGYTSWNILTNSATALVLHGATILTNMFFSPGVVAARTIANQVNSAAVGFVGNFRQACNPQIIKRFATKDYNGSKQLLVTSTKISYYMMLVLCLPIFFSADTLLKLWLDKVPEYSTSFLRLTLISSLFLAFGTSFFVPLSAKGRLKENAVVIAICHTLLICVSYVLFKIGFSPLSLAWALLIEEFFLCLVLKPILLVKIVGYEWNDLWAIFMPCIKVSILATPVPLSTFLVLNHNSFSELTNFVLNAFVSVVSVCVTVWFVGLNADMKSFFKTFFLKRLNK